MLDVPPDYSRHDPDVPFRPGCRAPHAPLQQLLQPPEHLSVLTSWHISEIFPRCL